MKYLFKAHLVPLLNNFRWIPIINRLIKTRKYRIIIKEASVIDELLADANKVIIDVDSKPFVGLAHYGNDVVVNPVNDNKLRYVNFFQYNNIPYELINLSSSDWQGKIEKFDIIVWALSSNPARLEEARQKIYLIEKYYKKLCFPSFDNAFIYENKIMQYALFQTFGLPFVQTFISYDSSESKDYIKSCEYPLVSKIQTGSGSRGVEIIRNYSQALNFINFAFTSGRSTYHTYLKQKDYVYFQKFVADSEYDLRIIVVGDKLFGYYRMKPSKDFRASGAGLVVKKELPEAAMRLAIECKTRMDAILLAVDMIASGGDEKFMIIEASIFFGIETAEQLHVNGVSGYYLHQQDKFEFHEGKYWVQELAMQEFINKWIS